MTTVTLVRTAVNRRVDPRTDRLYSLRNLLRTKAEKFNWPLMALGTNEDVLIAASTEGDNASEALLRASRSGRLPRFTSEGEAPSHSSLRFEVGDQELVLVAVGQEETGHEGSFPGLLESVLLGATAECVRRIFTEPNSLRPRGDEGPQVVTRDAAAQVVPLA